MRPLSPGDLVTETRTVWQTGVGLYREANGGYGYIRRVEEGEVGLFISDFGSLCHVIFGDRCYVTHTDRLQRVAL